MAKTRLTQAMRTGSFILQRKTDYVPVFTIRLYPSVSKITINGKRYRVNPPLAVDETLIAEMAELNNCTYFRLD